MLRRTDGFILYGDMSVGFFSASELLYPITKIRLPLIRTGSIFYMIVDNSNYRLGIVDCSLYTRLFLLKDDYHRKQMDMLKILAWSIITWKLQHRLSSFQPNKTSSSKESFSTMLQFVRLPLLWTKNLQSLDRTVKVNSGSNSLIPDKLKHSEVVNQL